MDSLDLKELRRAVEAHWNGDTLGALVYRMKTPVLLALLDRLEREEADACAQIETSASLIKK